jgi:stearoyl-CoA desaturase (delta-9 desaturase)
MRAPSSPKAPSILGSLPYAQFKRDPRFYVKYDALWGAAALALIAALVATGYQAPVAAFEPWVLLLLPVATYLLIMAHVFIHNASHGNFPKSINRIVGEICGLVVLTKFASWEIVHRRHHRYSDDPVNDPHPAERRYWPYAWHTLSRVEQQLQKEYYDCHGGETPENRRYETFRAVWSFGTGTCVILAWYFVLGPVLFFTVFAPASVLAGLFVVHFNWTGHNAHTKDGPIAPVNLDSGYFWWGNRMFFGIYYHANHHKVARAFNPMHLKLRADAPEEPEDAT